MTIITERVDDILLLAQIEAMEFLRCWMHIISGRMAIGKAGLSLGQLTQVWLSFYPLGSRSIG